MEQFYTIKDVEEMIHPERSIVDIEHQNKCIALTLDNGIVVKIRNF